MAKKTNYNKISNDTVANETVETTVTTEEVKETVAVKVVKGTVSNCTKLNIRKEPKKSADIVIVIPEKSKVDVEIDNSTDKWYKVITKNGIEGYCMKEYITLK